MCADLLTTSARDRYGTTTSCPAPASTLPSPDYESVANERDISTSRRVVLLRPRLLTLRLPDRLLTHRPLSTGLGCTPLDSVMLGLLIREGLARTYHPVGQSAPTRTVGYGKNQQAAQAAASESGVPLKAGAGVPAVPNGNHLSHGANALDIEVSDRIPRVSSAPRRAHADRLGTTDSDSHPSNEGQRSAAQSAQLGQSCGGAVNFWPANSQTSGASN